LLILENYDYSDLEEYINNDETIFGIELKEKLIPIIKIATILSNKYNIVITNPPYMNSSLMTNFLKRYINDYYKNVKGDMFSAFIVRNLSLLKKEGYSSYMTPYVWMFIATYEK